MAYPVPLPQLSRLLPELFLTRRNPLLAGAIALSLLAPFSGTIAQTMEMPPARGKAAVAKTESTPKFDGWEIMTTGDFDGDGKSDILWRKEDKEIDHYAVWLMDGRKVASITRFDGDKWWEAVGVADFDGDGHKDVLLRRWGGEYTVWLFKNGQPVKRGRFAAEETQEFQGFGDFDGDGKNDVLMRDKTTGQVIIWFMDGVAPRDISTFAAANNGEVTQTQTGSAPPPPPAGASKAALDAARFLAQTTFGPTERTIGQLQGTTFAAWLDQQMAMTPTSHVATLKQMQTTGTKIHEEALMESWWTQAIKNEDQLRQRMVFAWSEIMVVSTVNTPLGYDAWPLAAYLDVLGKHAFGNFRELLEAVTLSNAMGQYLDMIQSDKEDPSKNRNANENYARELLQLFTIGLVQLNPDGTPKLGTDGKPLPAFDEDTVQGFARAFTGWGWGGNDRSKPDHFYWPKNRDMTLPMEPWVSRHSTAPKKLLNGVTLPGGQTPEKDLKDALDNVFNHPNVGPFLAKRLIQRLVTSNPSPAYVARVAAVFNNNGAGVRGDLQAMTKAILLDPEARDGNLASGPTYGKLREPVVRFIHLLRAFDAKAKTGRFQIYDTSDEDDLNQAPLHAPSVFNFFSPFYAPANRLGPAGLAGPEFQILTTTSYQGYVNTIANTIYNGFGWDANKKLQLDLAPYDALAANPAELVAKLDLVIAHGKLSDTTKSKIIRAVMGVPAAKARQRVKTALLLVATSPDYLIQK